MAMEYQIGLCPFEATYVFFWVGQSQFIFTRKATFWNFQFGRSGWNFGTTCASNNIANCIMVNFYFLKNQSKVGCFVLCNFVKNTSGFLTKTVVLSKFPFYQRNRRNNMNILVKKHIKNNKKSSLFLWKK